ncbi:MAG: type II toxin-antitoxin system VapC family toxin [Janthinobacterium lividum]
MKNTVDTLIDAGPLVAVLNRNDDDHDECAGLIQSLDCRFYTTLAVVTEAMYLLWTRVGWVAQEALWRMILRGDLLLEHPSPAELVRMSELMNKYSDRPMDFADASLVALAERLSLNRIFTVDRRDFSTYRLHGKKSFTIIGPA